MTSLISCATFIVALALAGCTTVAQFREPEYSFSPAVAGTEVTFDVIDRRSAESKKFRVEEHEGVKTYLYGDAQFFPLRLRVLATHLAKAIPEVTPETVLIVDRFDIGHRVTRGHAIEGRGGCAFAYDCLALAIAVGLDKANSDRNVIACRLRGTFNNIAFDASFESAYADYDERKQPVRVLSVLYGAVDQAVKEVRNELNATKRPLSPGVERFPTLPSRWATKGKAGAGEPQPK